MENATKNLIFVARDSEQEENECCSKNMQRNNSLQIIKEKIVSY